jgi:ferredoxin
VRIRLDRTICDGFGVCAKHAPQYFSLDDWGYASLVGDGTVAAEDHDAVMRALMGCPVHAIAKASESKPADVPKPSQAVEGPPPPDPIVDGGEAEWGFTR